MRKMILLIVIFASFSCFAQTNASVAQRRSAHLRHGINLSEWFAQVYDPKGYTKEHLETWVTTDDIALIKKFCTLWLNDAVVNQPIRANSDTLECEIGQRWYNEAKAQWLALTQSRTKQPGAASGGAGAGGAATAWPSAPARLSASKMG